LTSTELTSFWGKHSETLQLCDDDLRRQRLVKTLIIGLDEIVRYCLNAVVETKDAVSGATSRFPKAESSPVGSTKQDCKSDGGP
jgi:adenine deaminase